MPIMLTCQAMQQWRAEVDALARARHPHVVLLLGCCPERGCVVYEYLPGGSLQEALQLRDAVRCGSSA